ncbi:hypothetical protein Tco_1328377 [Tanacetum coccineum]
MSMTSALSLGPLDPHNIDRSGRMDSWTMMQRRATAVMSSATSPDMSAGGRLNDMQGPDVGMQLGIDLAMLGCGVGSEEARDVEDVDRHRELSNSCLQLGSFYESVQTDVVRLEDVLKDTSL